MLTIFCSVGEMEYKTGDTRSNDASMLVFIIYNIHFHNLLLFSDFDESGGSQTQLTAKRWMRANANYSKIYNAPPF